MRASALFVERSVPQGSVLFPILFILFAGDLLSCVSISSVIMYVNDIDAVVSDMNRL